MMRPRLAAVAVGAAAVVLLSGCSSSSETRDVEIRLQNEINGLTARVESLESRMAWVEVVGRRAIQANPTAYEEQVVADLAALNAEFAAAQAQAAAVADQVAAQQAAAAAALVEAKAAVDAAVEAKRAQRAAAIEAAGQRVEEARAKLEELKQKIQDAIDGTASPSPSA